VQTTRVQLLEAAVATGRVQPAELEQESSALQGLRVRARRGGALAQAPSSLPTRAQPVAGEAGEESVAAGLPCSAAAAETGAVNRSAPT